MLARLLLLFILVPLIEVVILIRIGTHIGALNTIFMVIGIGLAGAWLARREGLRAFINIQRELAAGRLPGDAMIDGVLVLVAGLLMITPGVLTDMAGLLLLVPPVRAVVRASLKRRFSSRITFMRVGPDGFRSQQDDFIDVEAREPPPGPR